MAKNKNRQRGTNSPAVVVKDKIPLVSVIIPMYNAEKFVAQTLESLCYQTMKNFEVVVVDDCSTDNSVAVVESFKDKLIRGGAMSYHQVAEEQWQAGSFPKHRSSIYARKIRLLHGRRRLNHEDCAGRILHAC